MSEFKFEFGLGNKLRDKITGFVGHVMARTNYITGCDRYSLISLNKEESIKDNSESWTNFDANRLEFVSKGISIEDKKSKKKKPGGPQVMEIKGPHQ